MAGLAGPLCGIFNLSSWGLYDLPTADGQRWNPITWKNNLVMLDTNSPITKYLGNWGQMGMNNRNVNLPSAPGYDSNMGKDVVRTVADDKIKSCFDRIISVTSNLFDLTSVLGDNPIYSFDPVGLDRNKLIGNGTDWFSKPVWLGYMEIDKIGR
jgi:hypothetical protein